jgi:hypothetical protein
MVQKMLLMFMQAQLLGSNTLPAAAVQSQALPGGRYSCSYTAPAAAGLYVLEVTSKGRHLQGSPFSVRVDDNQPSDNSSSSGGSCWSQRQQQLDRSGWWGEKARTAYAAVDGSLDGFEERYNSCFNNGDSSGTGPAGLTGPEAEMVKVRRQQYMQCCCAYPRHD